MKRLFDIGFSLYFLIALSPLFVFISIWIVLDSHGGVFFRQIRVGKNGQEFKLIKFRTMRPASESKGQITVGMRDPRITKVGYVLRKYKLDELPQLINICLGQMSVVGPRPEVPKYVALYNESQRRVLSVRPGLTDLASLYYFEENAILAKAQDPEKTYIEEIMPHKLTLNLNYIEKASLWYDLKLISETVYRIFKR